MSARRRPTRTVGHALHVVVTAVRRLVDAVRHVRTGGATTRRQAKRRAGEPPRRCSKCHQPIPHSTDWRDHVDDRHRHPEWAQPPHHEPNVQPNVNERR